MADQGADQGGERVDVHGVNAVPTSVKFATLPLDGWRAVEPSRKWFQAGLERQPPVYSNIIPRRWIFASGAICGPERAATIAIES